ncbi:MAG: GTP-binding protein [Pseudomonadota bacterium]
MSILRVHLANQVVAISFAVRAITRPLSPIMKDLIPTNIITGFLGVGKTTAITHLLKHKPQDEIWSVLVNEFGEIGIDGALLKTVNAHVREVPGGCICCVAGLPMKIALNMMIATTKPNRIIIEPTGLGHPEEIINTLLGEYYDKVLDLRATITLLDPRKLSEARYSDNANFQDQLAIADVVVANKTDLCGTQEKQIFAELMDSFVPPKQAHYWVAQGQVEASWLDYPRVKRTVKNPQHHRNGVLNPQRELYNAAITLPEDKEFIRRENQANGFYSCGWLFNPKIQFDFNHLFGLLTGINVLRAKAVMNTEKGVFMFNAENGVLSVNQLDVQAANEILDSRIEIVDDHKIAADAVEKTLMATVLIAAA